MRQVFFDPFGRATEGYNLGMQQEQNLQRNVRDARAMDYDYNVMAPYRLAGAQRQNVLDTNNLPYQLQMAPLALDEARTALATHQLPLGEQFARTTGITAPYLNTYAHAFGLTPTGYGPNGVNYAMRGPNGEQLNVGAASPQTVLNQLYLPQQMQASEIAARNNYYQSMADYGRSGPYAAMYDMARAGYYNAGGPAMGRVGAGAQAQPLSLDHFYGPTKAGQSDQGTGGVNYGQPGNPYNLPNQGGFNPGSSPNAVQNLQQYDYQQ